MAFFRFSRDKRGYEHFYLVEPTTNRRGKSRPRVLYWFRSPPNVKIGREPFDDDVRRALEAQNPNVTFDWRKILETPIPSAEVDKWRERRRVERAARQFARGSTVPEEDRAAPDEPASGHSESEAPAEAESIPTVVESAAAATAAPSRIERARRRRRRRKGGHGQRPAIAAPTRGAEPATHGDGAASAPAQGEPPARDDGANEPTGE